MLCLLALIAVLNQDCSEFQASFPPEKMTVAGAEEYFDRMNCGGNTHLFINPQAHNAYYPSKVMNVVWEGDARVGLPKRAFRGREFVDLPEVPRVIANSKLLAERGVDWVGVWVARARARGISPWVSMRMNDTHDIFLPSSFSVSTFWLDHPEFRRVPGSDGWRDGKPNWSDAALDFAHPEVRARALAIAREMLEKWDVDGIECDWMRFPHHVKDEEELNHTGHRHLTAYMRELRKLADEIGARKGRRLQVAARVVSRPEGAFGFGTDVETWAREGLVDVVIASEFLYESDFALPCLRWKGLLARANPRVKFLAGIDGTGVTRDGAHCGLTRAELCGYFERMLEEGADGAYFFNYFRCNPADPASRLVHQEGVCDAARLRAEARAYPVTFLSQMPAGLSCETKFPARLDVRREYRLPVGRAGTPSSVRLRLLLDRPIPETARLAVTLNGSASVSVKKVALPRKVRADRHAYELDYPVSSLLDGDNFVIVRPAGFDVTLLHVDLLLGASKACPSAELPLAAKPSGTTCTKDAVQPYVDNGQCAGLVSILYSRGVCEVGCIGWADREAKRPMTLDSMYMIASQSKGVCGAAAAILVEEGRLGLDEPVCKYLPAYSNLTVWTTVRGADGKNVRTPVAARNRMTVRQLFTHTAGLPFDTKVRNVLGATRVPIKVIAAIAATEPLACEPGTRFAYSTLGIDVAAAVVEAASGQRIEDFLRQRLFGPLGMHDTTFWPSDEQLARAMMPYWVGGDQPARRIPGRARMPRPYNGPDVFPSLGAGLWSSPRDLVKFYKMLLNRGVGDNGVRILRAETVMNLFEKDQLPPDLVGKAKPYSLGMHVDGDSGWYGHGGAWTTDCRINPKEDKLKLLAQQIDYVWPKEEPKPFLDALHRAEDEFLKRKSGEDAGGAEFVGRRGGG